MYRLLLPLVFLILQSCSTLPTDKKTYTTDNWQIVARDGYVETQLFEQHLQNQLYVFSRIVNTDVNNGYCVAVEFRVIDFDINIPDTFIYIDPDSIRDIGYMKQSKSLNFEGLIIKSQPQGYFEKMTIIEPNDRELCYDL